MPLFLLCCSEDDGCSWNLRGQPVIRLEVKWITLHDCAAEGAEGQQRTLQRKSKRQGSWFEQSCWLTLQSHCNVADNSPQVRLEAWRAAGTCCHSLKVTISQCRQVLDTALPLGLCISERFSNHLCCSHKSGKNKNKYESTYRLQHSHPASELIFSTNHTACNHPLQNKSPTIFSAWAKKSLFHSRFEYANAFFFFFCPFQTSWFLPCTWKAKAELVL